jgi:hypothetical protein
MKPHIEMIIIPTLQSGRKNLESVNKLFMFGILDKIKNYFLPRLERLNATPAPVEGLI